MREEQDKRLLREDKTFISRQKTETQKELVNRRQTIEKMLDLKQKRSKTEFKMKKEVLTSSFGSSVQSLIRKIKKQKEIITGSYGPLVLNSKKTERPIFNINSEIDPNGAKWVQRINEDQDKIPQTVLVKLRTVRCMKDKVSSGHYLMIVHAMDRLGGNRLHLNPQKVMTQYGVLSQNLRSFAKKKRAFLNAENRQMETKSGQFVAAAQTGLQFYQKEQETEENDDDEAGPAILGGEGANKLNNSQIETSHMQADQPIDYEKDIQIDLEKTYCQYVRFNGRA